MKGVGMFFVLYLILGNVEEGFSGGEKVNTPYKSFPWGLLSFSLKPRVKENASTSIISLNNIFLYQHLGFPCLYLCMYLCCPDNNSEFFAPCDFGGGHHQQPDVFEKDLFFFNFFIIFMGWCWCSHDGPLLLMVPCDCDGGRRQPAVSQNRWQHWPDQCHLEQLRGTRTAVMVKGLV